MQTLVVAAMLYELANKAHRFTGGADGLQGMQVWPVFGVFRFDMFGRTAFLYCLAVLFVCWLVVRTIVHSAFGHSLMGIRENVLRMQAIGAPVDQRKLLAYALSAALAGISGALIAQTTQFVGLGVLSLERSGTILIMLIIGGVGQLYGAFIGVPLYMIAQDRFATVDPVYGRFWIAFSWCCWFCSRVAACSGSLRDGEGGAGPDMNAIETVQLRRALAHLSSPTPSISAWRRARGTRWAERRGQDQLRQPCLRRAAAELRPDTLTGEDVTDLRQAQRVKRGLVRTFQINTLFRRLSVLENVTLAIAERDGVAGDFVRPAGRHRAAIDEAFALLEQLGLGRRR
jgi:hypothetical protein